MGKLNSSGRRPVAWQPPDQHPKPLAVPHNPPLLFLHPQGMNEAAGDALNQHLVASVHALALGERSGEVAGSQRSLFQSRPTNRPCLAALPKAVHIDMARQVFAGTGSFEDSNGGIDVRQVGIGLGDLALVELDRGDDLLPLPAQCRDCAYLGHSLTR